MKNKNKFIIIIICFISIIYSQQTFVFPHLLEQSGDISSAESFTNDVFFQSFPPNTPTEVQVQIWDTDGNQWQNHTRYEYFSPTENLLYIFIDGWNPAGLAWGMNSVYEIYWTNGNVDFWQAFGPSGLIQNSNFDGPYFNGLPTQIWTTQYEPTEVQEQRRWEFDVSGNPTRESLWENNNGVWTEASRLDIVYHPDYPPCPQTYTFFTCENGNCSEASQTVCTYDVPSCAIDDIPFNLVDVQGCLPNQIQTIYLSGDQTNNIMHDINRAIDLQCLVNSQEVYFADNISYTDIRSDLSYTQTVEKMNTSNDNSNFRLTKIENQVSIDGIEWTDHSRVWISYDGLPLDTKENASSPILFDLNQNYPNPFNPTTTITFELPQESNISIKIYNTLGNEIKSLINEFKTIGQYQIIWDGTDHTGEIVSGGTYFCQLKAGDFVQTRKMVLLK